MTATQAPPVEMRTLRMLVGLGFVAALVAVGALIWFELADPAEGTALYDTLGPIAAFSGIASGMLFAASAIWAAVKGLWEHVPNWIRYTATALIVAFAVLGPVLRSAS